MSTRMKKKPHSVEFKLGGAEAIRGEKTTGGIVSRIWDYELTIICLEEAFAGAWDQCVC